MTLDPVVFLSYAEDTRGAAQALADEMKKHGVDVWSDFRELQPGQNWAQSLEEALERCWGLVVLVKPNSITTPHREAEWQAVLRHAWSHPAKVLLPVIMGKGKCPPFLQSWEALRIDPSDSVESWSEQILVALSDEKFVRLLTRNTSDDPEREARVEQIKQLVLRHLRQSNLGRIPGIGVKR